MERRKLTRAVPRRREPAIAVVVFALIFGGVWTVRGGAFELSSAIGCAVVAVAVTTVVGVVWRRRRGCVSSAGSITGAGPHSERTSDRA